MQSFYETGFYQYGRQLAIEYNRLFAKPVLRELYQSGQLDDYTIKPLSLQELRDSFFILCYALVLVLCVATVEVGKKWAEI